ncbi:hypothetical protein BD779DRAFT_1474071 [Infundibulicybe gibba]|nr:hypothetical protein BD779DRAFT_1474071 [Infundibulicybe gibba]
MNAHLHCERHLGYKWVTNGVPVLWTIPDRKRHLGCERWCSNRKKTPTHTLTFASPTLRLACPVGVTGACGWPTPGSPAPSTLAAVFAMPFDAKWGREPRFVWPLRVFGKTVVNPRGLVPVLVVGMVLRAEARVQW